MSPPDSTEREFTGTSRFEVVRRIGAGGIGLVYEAIDHEDQSRVAIKTLQRLDSDGLLRFKNEFRLLQGLHHRNLVRLGELFEHEGQWFFTMELLDGVDFMGHVAPSSFHQGATFAGDQALTETSEESASAPTDDTAQLEEITPLWRELYNVDERSASRPRGQHSFDEERLRDALRQLAEGLNVLHDAGKVHRDIKPQNVMVTGDRVVLLDFGLVSEQSGESSLERGMVLGTPAYMSPEQAAGKPTTAASDWYGVGCMLYEALVGKRPFEGSSGKIMLAKQSMDPPRPASVAETVPGDLDELCMDLLHRDPGDRPTGQEVVARLAGITTGSGVARTMSEGAASERTRVPVPLIGREVFLEVLERAFLQRSHGRPVAVFVHGSSGMGKTALVEQFAARLRERKPASALCLRGRCYERESVPYKAFDGIVDAMARYLKRPDAGAEFLVPHRIDMLVRLFPVLQGVRRPLGLPESKAAGARDPQELRREAFAALKELLARIAAKLPLVIMIDDLQWGDFDSAALLTEILSPPTAPGVLFIASYRSEEGDNALLSSLRESVTRAVGSRHVHEMEVGPLGQDDCRRLAIASLEMLTGKRDPGNQVLAEALARESAGSPFFVSELVRYLVVTEADRSGAHPTGVTLEDVLVARRDRLDQDARAALDVVAVAGRPIAQGVALYAAGLAARQRAVFDALRAEHLVRTRGPTSKDAVECYHDRIREAVVAMLTPAELEHKNRQLAAAFEALGTGDAEILAECYRGAGEPVRAAEYALKAAENAERALAFDRAARMYRMVLEIRPGSDEEARGLRIRLGEALVNAARGSEAAAEFLAAAHEGDEAEAIALKRRAAEQLLRSGRIDEGLALLGEVLTASKLYVPRTDQGALASLAWNRAKLRLRGLDFASRPDAEISTRDRQRVDVCWAGAVGLGMVDPIRGADFGTRCLLMALDAGDEARIARTLAMEAAQVATGGGKSTARAEALADRAADMARRIDDPHALGLAILGSGAAALLSGRWRAAYEECRRAESVLREHCTGVAWETTTLRTLQLAALYYLGQWSSMHERAAVALRQALDRGDLYMVASLVSYATFARLADDDVDGARLTIRNATVKWSLSGYHVQHYLKLMSHLFADLYEGEGAKAWDRLQQEWPHMSRSLLKRVQLVRIEMAHGRARCALARVVESRGRSPGSQAGASDEVELLRVALSDARRIERERMAWATPLGGLVRAAVAACRGDAERAVASLEAAATQLDDADMLLFADAARYRMGQLLGASRGDELMSEAVQSMRSQGIANPARLVHTLAPGFPYSA